MSIRKENILRELHEIFKEISIIPPKSFEQFYDEHKDDDEKYLLQMLKIGKQVIDTIRK